jgi:hypothetical protein
LADCQPTRMRIHIDDALILFMKFHGTRNPTYGHHKYTPCLGIPGRMCRSTLLRKQWLRLWGCCLQIAFRNRPTALWGCRCMYLGTGQQACAVACPLVNKTANRDRGGKEVLNGLSPLRHWSPPSTGLRHTDR